jgi:hypothetical protein
MNASDFNGQRFALWLINDDDESCVYGGFVAKFENGELFLHRPGTPPFEVRPEWMHRIEKVENETVREILDNADYYLRLTLRPVPEGEDLASYFQTGLKWVETNEGSH